MTKTKIVSNFKGQNYTLIKFKMLSTFTLLFWNGKNDLSYPMQIFWFRREGNIMPQV